MNISPLHTYEPKDRPWVIRWLRYMGYLSVLISIIVGIIVLSPIFTQFVATFYNLDYNGASGFGYILGAVAGFFGGLILSVPYWAIAMLLDDIRAIRAQTSGYAAIGDKSGGV